MTDRTTCVLAAMLALSACSFHDRPVEQLSVSHTVAQDALVMAPEAPSAVGRPLTPGMTSLSALAGLTHTRAPGDDVGQQAIPVTGGLRGAAGIARGMEVAVSGSVGTPRVDPGPFAAAIEQPDGFLGRGAVGIRGFVPTMEGLDVGLSVDLGAEASTFRRTDTTVITHRDRYGTSSQQTQEASYDLRVKPHVRSAFLVRANVPQLPLSVMGGGQVQNWTVYWAEANHTETCTRYRSGQTACASEGSIPERPTRTVVLLTPSAGVSLQTDVADIHLQTFMHLGPEAAQAVPWGAMVTLELLGSGRAQDVQTVAAR